MVIVSRHSVVIASVMLWSAGVLAARATAAQPAAGSRFAHAPAPPSILASRPKIVVRTRASSAAATLYRIDDLGMPSPKAYDTSTPVGFNNSGQIYGTALPKAKEDLYSYLSDTDCIVWTGTKFVDLMPSLTVEACFPYALNSAGSPGGNFNVVGALEDVHHAIDRVAPYRQGSGAFRATVLTNGSLKIEPFYDHSPAALFGVNAASAATGFSFDELSERSNNYFTAYDSEAPETLTKLQPQCSPNVSGCLAPLQFADKTFHAFDQPGLPCPFGGCTINDGGRILGFDLGSKKYGTFVADTAGAAQEYDLPTPVVSLNNANQILAMSIDGTNVTPVVFDIATGVSTLIAPIAGKSCTRYVPVSLNDLGEVLGYTSCSPPNIYWVWDAVRGTRDLAPDIPASGYRIQALAINDNAQILVSLETSMGELHWGRLEPPVAAAAHRSSVNAHHRVR